MTLFLQHKVNNHILGGVHYLWWPSDFPGGNYVSACAEQRSAEFRTLLYITLATPLYGASFNDYIDIAIISISIIDHSQISYIANYL